MITKEKTRSLIKEVREFKKQSGLPVEAIAHEVGVSFTTMYRWISGDIKKPNPASLILLDAFLEKNHRKATAQQTA